ncbi:Transcriptional factor B3 family protein [Euphorbia peplus]|nr:Transcriptional factor B3 family protein [Euphorbia peplus]
MAEKRRLKTPTTPHFFRPLLPGFQHQLSIPVSFYLKHLKEKNAEKTVLRSPSGKLWHVKIKGRLIEDGWQEFCEDHQLHVGHFLVFRFHDHHHHHNEFLFDVLVFDSTACQRDYPLYIKNEILETPHEEIRKESPGPLKKKRKKRVNKFEGKSGSSASKYPHFMLQFSPYAANCALLYIPKGFAQANGLNNRCCKIVLLNKQGKVWVAVLGFRPHDGQSYVKQNWSAFRCANSIKAGDSCLFELIRDGERPVLKITKSGYPRELQPNLEPEKQPTNNITHAGAGSSMRNLSVCVIVKEGYMKKNVLRIPYKFAKKSGLLREQPELMTFRNEKGRSWEVSLRKNTSGGVCIGTGWSTFARSNDIKSGDVLMLELIWKGTKPVMRISGVNRGRENEGNSW